MAEAVHPQELQYMLTQNLPPHPILAWALGNFVVSSGMKALDLGCGAGRDTRALVRAGFSEVVALDACPIADAYVKKGMSVQQQSKLNFVCGAYPDSCPTGSFDLINAQFTLSHNPREVFDRAVSGIRRQLNPGGLFVGNFLGDRHPYNRSGASFTFPSGQEVEGLFEGMEYLRFDEREEEGPIPYAGEQWHWFDVVARKPSV